MAGIDKYTKLLLHMNDNTFKDECGHEVINNGVTLDTTNKKFGNGSNYFNGGSWLTIPKNSDFNFVGDFTIDMWIKGEEQLFDYPCLLSNWTSAWIGDSISLTFTNASYPNKICFATGTSLGSVFLVNGVKNTNDNNWHHLAIVRYNEIIVMYYDGVRQSNASCAVPLDFSRYNLIIGSSDQKYKGNIDEFRISNIARWTSDFEPPKREYGSNLYLIQDKSNILYTLEEDKYTKLLLHMDDNNFKDEMGNTVINNGVTLDTSNKKFGNGSAYFNETGNHLKLMNENNNLNFYNSDFTIDFWMCYNRTQTTNSPIFGNSTGTTWTNDNIAIHSNCSSGVNKISFWVYNANSSSALLYSTTTLVTNIWYHVAIVRNSGTCKLYINGICEAIATYNGNVNLCITQSCILGTTMWHLNNGSYYLGYIDEFRISNIARWTSDFTPPNNAYGLVSSLDNLNTTTLTEDLFKNKEFPDPTIIKNQQINKKGIYGVDKGSLGSGKIFKFSLSNDMKTIENIK